MNVIVSCCLVHVSESCKAGSCEQNYCSGSVSQRVRKRGDELVNVCVGGYCL